MYDPFLYSFQVFSAFGYVHKIATFEKAAGFQALIQYTDADTASAAREALDGRSIPSYLLPEHVTSCCLRISFSAHKDLNIKFQSNRSRDYNNPYLPINYSAMDGTLQVFTFSENHEHSSISILSLLLFYMNLLFFSFDVLA
ncbi:Polypyrimidine tract-binding protein homolog 1 [Zea mays]|uniref:Polypyrimidine tract-binding protein homolog 1 n=1 Tax=Zea mays TaxID=4577 RepID=A0A1D6K4C7_MAIZE|nr:Polypyrimidine tract-binding protein homolog 1 [Zea mays]